MKKFIFLLTIFLVLFYLSYDICAQEKKNTASTSLKLDIVLVLDNSGSMKTNDPEFFTKKVVSNFLDGLPTDSRISFVIFAEDVELAMPLTSVVEKETKGKVDETLAEVNYSGQYTDIPAAIERAIYELKQNGRKDAEKLIVFITDGVIDTGDRAKDIERKKWLKDELAEESKALGIRIFGIAFTEQADYELIQTLGQKTDGGYYRALKLEDIQGLFNSIQQTISKPRQQVEPEVIPPPPPPEGIKKALLLLLVAIVGLIVLGIIAVVFITRKVPKKVEITEDLAIPEAELLDIDGATDKPAHKINKPIVGICREEPDKRDKDMDIIIVNKKTVSGLHAIIEYKDHNFYLIDRRSTNGTYVNEGIKRNERISPDNPILIKSGDVIAFDEYRFEFKTAGQIRRGGTELGITSGGTVLRVPESPEKPPTQEPIEEDGGKEITPSPPEQKPEVVPSSPSDEDKGTVVKPAYCPDHPSFKATELCPVCKKAYCFKCMVEKDGRKICSKCIEEGNV